MKVDKLNITDKRLLHKVEEVWGDAKIFYAELLKAGLKWDLGHYYIGHDGWPILGYRGLMVLAKKADIWVEVQEVREGDQFEITLGSDKKIVHLPSFKGEVINVYAIARGRTMGEWFFVLSKEDATRLAYNSKNPQFWNDKFVDMWKKSALARALNLAGVTSPLAYRDYTDLDTEKELTTENVKNYLEERKNGNK